MRPRPALILLLAGVLLLVAAGPASAKTRTDRVIQDSRITESSGLAPSRVHSGVLWTHNDSGNPNQIFAIAKDGSTAATVTIAGQENRDWEAITSFRSPAAAPAAGQNLIAVGDIGDNDAEHPSVRILIVKEPETLTDQSITPIRVLQLTYPGGPTDAESLLSDPKTGRLYIVSKTLFGSTLYAVPPKVWPGKGATGTSEVTELTKVADMGPSFVTDGAFLPDGNMAIRGYGNLSIVAAPSTVKNGRLKTLASKALPDQKQGESIAIVDDGAYALIGSEGQDSPILKIRVPQVAPTKTTAAAAPTTSSAQKATEKLSGLVSDNSRRNLLIAVGGSLLALIAVANAALVLLRPNRNRRRRR